MMFPTRALLATVLLALVGVPVGAQTLAEASAKAKADRATGQQWPASANAVPVFDPVAAAAWAAAAGDLVLVNDAATVTTTTTSGSASTTSATPVTKDETYWKTRMRTLTTKLSDDSNYLLAAETNERALNTKLHLPVDNINAIANRRQLALLEDQWQDSVKEVSRLKAAVKNDTRAKADLELEAHRAGVPAGWLILE